MAHIFNGKSITTHFDLINGDICLIYTGKWKGSSNDVYREFENGTNERRCLYSTSFGYQFAIPGEIISNSYYSGYYKQRQEYEEWRDSPEYDFSSDLLTEEDKKIILSKYPAFKYTIEKWSKQKGRLSSSSVMLCLRIWLKHPQIELLLAAGLQNIAFNKSFYKLTEKKRNEVLNWCKVHKGNYCLNEVQTMLKYNISPATYKYYTQQRNRYGYGVVLSYPEYEYLYKTNQLNDTDIEFYRDYKRMLKESDHSIKDKYWLYPSNIHERHQKLMKEKKAKEELLKAEKNEMYINKIKDLFKYKSEVDGYEIFIPESLGDWVVQADALHQCILWAHYDDKVIDRDNYCLVFIRKNGIPVATAEVIGKEKKIGQFYTDEHNRAACRPTEELKATFNKWLVDFSFDKEVAA